jgi:hypothetical protein
MGDIVLNPQPTDNPNDPLNWLEPLIFIETIKKLTCKVYGCQNGHSLHPIADSWCYCVVCSPFYLLPQPRRLK